MIYQREGFTGKTGRATIDPLSVTGTVVLIYDLFTFSL